MWKETWRQYRFLIIGAALITLAMIITWVFALSYVEVNDDNSPMFWFLGTECGLFIASGISFYLYLEGH